MKIGLLSKVDSSELDFMAKFGFRSMEWVKFAEGPCRPEIKDWKAGADRVREETAARSIRISAIAALYQNPLDPVQTENARLVFERAIETASFLGIKTVAGFCGAVIQQEHNARGGNLIPKRFEQFLPDILHFWEPIARKAADCGVRIAFEHCPQGAFHLPVMGYNFMDCPSRWELFFNETKADNIGLEWDASHLVCQLIDPLENIRKFGSRIFHVHAKDARMNRRLLAAYGICHHGVAEHRLPGFGDSDWGQIIHELIRAGYDSDLNIEGWHDPVLRDHNESGEIPVLRGQKLEAQGLIAAKKHLEQFIGAAE
jgi:sugar phosphate isomerase/epimerase